MDQTRQPFKAPRNLDAINGGAAADAILLAQSNATGSNPAVIPTGDFPNPVTVTGGVVAAFATVTPKVTGKFRVRASIQSETNATGAAGTVLLGIGHSAVAPTIGTTVVIDDGGTGATPAGTRTTAAVSSVAINGSESEVLSYLYGQAGSPCSVPAFPLGVPVSFSVVASQSAAAIMGAVNAVAAGNAWIEVQEIP